MKSYLPGDFSVLLPIYLKADPCELQQCLKSLVNQTLVPGEVVVVEDGPITDELDNVLVEYSTKVNLVRHQCLEHRGLGPALQEGLLRCSHPIIARMDSDDVSVPLRFEQQMAFLNFHPEISVVGGTLRETFSSASDQESSVELNRELPVDPRKLRAFARFRNPLNHPTVMFRRAAILEVGGYQDCPYFEDYFLWVRLLLSQKKLANLPCVVVDTTADDSYFDRRTGRDYQKSERDFACRLLELKFHTNFEHIVFRISRAPVRWMSTQFARKFYGYILRQSQK